MPRVAGRVLIEGGTVVSFDPPEVIQTDLLIENGTITERGKRLDPLGEVTRIDARGKVVMPGCVSAHARLAANLIGGLDGQGGPVEEREARDRDRARAQSEESIICSAFSGAMRALQSGTTGLVISHDSPGCIDGSLTRLREVLLTVGLRAVVSYRVSERDGADVMSEALAATRAAALHGGGETLRYAVGIGHPSELPDTTLRALGVLMAETEAPVHGEVGTHKEEGAKEVARLEKAGLLGPQTILRTGPHLDEKAAATLIEAGVQLVGCPRTALAAGHPPHWLNLLGNAGALGTDDGAPDVWAEARLAFDGARGRGVDRPAEEAIALLSGGNRVMSRVFGIPFGGLQTGSAADLVIVDYAPLLPLNSESLPAWLLQDGARARLQIVMVNGRVLLRDGNFTTLGDMSPLLTHIQRGALDYWARLCGTAFPGLEAALRLEAEEEEAARAAEEERARAEAEDAAEDAEDDADGEDEDEEFDSEDSDEDVSEDEEDDDEDPTTSEFDDEDIDEGDDVVDVVEEESDDGDTPEPEEAAETPEEQDSEDEEAAAERRQKRRRRGTRSRPSPKDTDQESAEPEEDSNPEATSDQIAEAPEDDDSAGEDSSPNEDQDSEDDKPDWPDIPFGDGIF